MAWFLDSGCTDHIIKSNTHFHKFVMLENSKNC